MQGPGGLGTGVGLLVGAGQFRHSWLQGVVALGWSPGSVLGELDPRTSACRYRAPRAEC